MSNRRRVCLAVAAAGPVCAFGGAALARSTRFQISKVAVPRSVKARALDAPQGKGFKVKVTGSAPSESALDVYLDHKKCPTSASAEAKRDGGYKAGYSFFVGPSSVTSTDVKGSFAKSFTAHPGSKTGTRYVCVYLASGTTTRAFRSTVFQVTK